MLKKSIQEEKIIYSNRQASHNYFILETIEAGIMLVGTEVKSLRNGKVNLKDSFGQIVNGNVLLLNMYIGPYEYGNINNHEPLRTRKLLLNKSEIIRLIGKIKEKGLVLVPLKIYFNRKGIAKIELALCKGKKLYDKRETLKNKESQREMERVFKDKRN